MSTVAQKTGQVLNAASSLTGTIGGIVGGEAGAILGGAALLTKGLADLLSKGASVHEVLTHMSTMPDVVLKWSPSIEDTAQATPNAKKGLPPGGQQ